MSIIVSQKIDNLLTEDLAALNAAPADQATLRGLIKAVGTDLEITTALQGTAGDATRIGAEYLPLQTINTDIPNTLLLGGVSDPVPPDPFELTRTYDLNGYPRWINGFWSVYWNLGTWYVVCNDVLNGQYSASSVSDALIPEGLTFLVSFGTGAVTVASTSDMVLSNASINAAIATDPAASRAAMSITTDLIQNRESLARFHNHFQTLNNPTAGTTYVGLTGFGDSMADLSYTLGYVLQDLENRYGTGCVSSPGLGQTWNGSSWTYAGGAAKLAAEYTRFPGSNEISIPASGSATIVFPGVASIGRRGSGGDFGYLGSGLGVADNQFNLPKGIRKVTVVYLKLPSAGTLGITLSQPGVANQTASVNCDAAELLASTDFTPTNRAGAITVECAATVGTVRVVGVIYWGCHGVTWLNSNVGGSSMESQKVCLSGGEFKAPFVDLLTLLKIKGVIGVQRIGNEPNHESNYETFFDAFDALDIGHIEFAEPPRWTAHTTMPETVNAYLEAECKTRGYVFYDRYKIATLAECVAAGWATDESHLTGPYHRFDAGVFLREVGAFDSAAGKSSRGLMESRLADERFKSLTLIEAKRETIRGSKGIETETAVISGAGYWAAVDNERGFRFGAANIGHAMARIASLGTTRTAIDVANSPLAFSGSGYRNINIPADYSAFLLFGCSATNITTLVGLAQRCFGIEFARGSTIGEAHLDGDACVRIIACDDTTTTASPWVNCRGNAGAGNVNALGFRFVLLLDTTENMLFLFSGTDYENDITLATRLTATLPMPAMSGSATSGHWVQAGIYSASAVAGSGEMGWRQISCTQGLLGAPNF